MADDAPDYRELMAQLEAAFASEQPRGLSEFKGPMTDRPEVSGEQALVPKAWANEQAESRSGGVNVGMGPFSGGARVTADEYGRPVNVGLSASAGPASYQYGRAPAHGAPGQHTFNLNLDPADVGARLQAILQQGPGGQRSYGVGTGGDGWGVQVMHDPQRRATQISGGMQKRFAEGGPVYDELGNMIIGDNTDYRDMPGYGAIEAASIGAEDAARNYLGNVADAFRDSSEYARLGLENTVSDKGPGYNVIGPAQYMLGSLGAVSAPLTGAFKSAGQGATELSGNPDIGNRLEAILGILPFGGGAAKGAARAPAKLRAAEEEGIKYATQQEGPFYRVRSPSAEELGSNYRGIKEAAEHDAGIAPPVGGGSGPARGGVPKLLSDEELQAILKSPEQNTLLSRATAYTGADFQPVKMAPSSLAKQSAIGRTFEIAAEGSPEYKASVFEAYKREMPDVVKESGAKNYDELLAASYKQMAKETKDQFDSLPLSYSFHKNGEGNYASSAEMAKDVQGNGHLYVFQGGDPHDFLHNVDPRTGLNENEMFRAVHDAYGHAVHGNQFGAKGEEIAWGLHQQMYSPLAKLAMTAETRGQNSFVNYSPINAKLKERLNELEELRVEARRRGDKEGMSEAAEAKKKAYNEFQYAPQKAVLLPPEFVSTEYVGGMPAYLEAVNKPKPGTTVSAELTHFSPAEGLTELDPARYGTGIPGDERSRLIRKSGETVPGSVRDRTYFYTSDPEKVIPEAGLGQNRYRSNSDNLYDIVADPRDFKKLARESLRNPWDTNFNPGIVDQTQVANALDRLVKEYGYEGMVNSNAAFPMATVFKPKAVEPFAYGGSVDGGLDGLVQKYDLPGYARGGIKQAVANFEGPEAQGASSPSWEGIGEALSGIGAGISDLYSTPEADLSAYMQAPEASSRRAITPSMLGAALNPEAQGSSSPSLEGVGEVMHSMGEDPAALIGGMLPGIGNALAAADVAKLKDKISVLRTAGADEEANKLQRFLPLAAAGVVMPFGGGAAARGALKAGEKAALRGAEEAALRGAGPELRASTRFPTGKSATENPLLEQLTIGPKEMRETPTFEHNMGLLPEYPGFAHLKDRSPEEQLAGYMDQARDNLNFLYENAPSVMRERSPSWYNGANNFSDALSERYGIPRQSSSAAIAALSPQMDWFKNASLAERVGDVIFGPTASIRMTPEMESFQRNSTALTSPANQAVFDSIAGKKFSDLTDPLDQALWIRLYDEAHNARNYRSITPEGQLGHFITNDDGSVAKIGWGSLNEIEKAVRAYTSGGDMNVISPMLGTKHKVRSFYNNIELPDDLRFGDVTADTHAVAASQLRPLSGNTPAVAHNLASGLAKNKQPPNYVSEKSSAVTGVQGTYGANAEATRMAAADQGLIPRQMQSATWEPVRELFPAKWKNAKNVEAVDNIWREKDAGNLTAEQARNAIFELAGGFREPTWAQRGPAPVDPRRGSTYR